MGYLENLNEYFIKGELYINTETNKVEIYNGISAITCGGYICDTHSTLGKCTGIHLEFNGIGGRCAYCGDGSTRYIKLNGSNTRW